MSYDCQTSGSPIIKVLGLKTPVEAALHFWLYYQPERLAETVVEVTHRNFERWQIVVSIDQAGNVTARDIESDDTQAVADPPGGESEFPF